MYVTSWDIASVVFALGIALVFITGCAVANARLERERNEWRKAYYEAKGGWDSCTADNCHQCNCAVCD